MPNPPDVVQQYRTACESGGYCRRDDRALIEATGKDRASWLNNLVTNVVKTLQPGEGNYAFATNVKGRAVFDVNVLALDDRLWLDFDQRQVETVRKHLDRYIITEDVRLAEPAPRLERFAILGPRAAEAAAQLGLGNLAAMSQLQHVPGHIDSSPARFIRNDFAGLTAVELVVAESDGRKVQTVIESLADKYQWTQLSSPTIDILRIEAGIPASIDDIDEDVVPPETGQIERGISYHKGCYLGQEVIERMRSHGILARRLVGLRIDGEQLVAHNTEITSESAVVGRVTSCCFSETLSAVLALGYVKTNHSKSATPLKVSTGGIDRPTEVIELPVRR